MSKASQRETDDRRGEAEDIQEAPTGQVNDDSYTTSGGRGGNTDSVPVVNDNTAVEDPIATDTADSDKQLGMPLHMERSRTTEVRDNKPKPGALREPSDSELGLAEEEMN